MGTVKTDHDAIERNLALHGSGVAIGKVRELGPGIELAIGDKGVEVGFLGLVLVARQGADAAGFAGFDVGVGSASNGAADTQADFFAFLLINANDVDFAQEFARFLNLGFELLLDARVDVKRGAGRLDAVEFGHLAKVASKEFSCVVAHGCLRSWAGVCGPSGQNSASAWLPPPVTGGRASWE